MASDEEFLKNIENLNKNLETHKKSNLTNKINENQLIYKRNNPFINEINRDETGSVSNNKFDNNENTLLIGNDEKLLNNLLIKNLYNYHYKGGFNNIVIDNINSLCINYFLLFLINFITNCINYSKIYHFSSKNNSSANISEFITISNWFPSNWYLLISLILYLIYLLCYTYNTINNIILCKKIKNIYENKLEIIEKELKYYSWHEIVEIIISKFSNPNLNIYTINSIICLEDNIMIYLLRNKIINTAYISSLLEINIQYCFVDSLIDNNNKISDHNLENYNKKIRTRLQLVFIINIITLPFSLYVILIYNLINYGENLYNDPGFLFNRIWTTKSLWRLKFYNELPHEFDKRIKILETTSNTIINSRQNRSYYNIFKFINFVLGSIFILLIMATLINEDLLTNCQVIKNRTILWTIGVLGSIILLIKKLNKVGQFIKDDVLKENLNELKENIGSINPKWFSEHMYYIFVKLLKSMYQNKVNIIILEIFYVTITPYYIYKWLYDYIYIDVKKIISNHYVLGNVCKHSIFTNYNLIKSDPHMYYSVDQFKKNNPNWNTKLLFLPTNENDEELGTLYQTFNWNNNTKRIDDLSFSVDLNSSYILNK